MIESLIESARSAERAGMWDRAMEQYEAALVHLRRQRHGDPARITEILRWIGTMYRERGALEIASELYEASVAVAEAHRLRDQLAAGLNCLAIVTQFAGESGRAEELYLRSRQIAVELDQVHLIAMIDQNRGTLANIRGDLATAVEHYRSALGCFQQLGDELGVAWCLNNIGMAQLDSQEWEAAEESFDRAFTLADRLGSLSTLGNVEINRAELHLQRGDFASAREHCDRAFEIFGRLESKTGLGEAHKLYGALHREAQKHFLADMHLLLALELARTSQDRLLEAEAERERALATIALGRDREALECLNRAHRLFSDLQASREVLDIERRQSRLEKTYLQIVTRWSASIDSLDRHMAGHSARVADLACRLGERLGLGAEDLTALRVAALLHDLGKTALPAEVLRKPGPLTSEEWELIRGHPAVGARLITEQGIPWDVAPIVHSHLEHWDGSGFPDGLRGPEIPLGARILHVADSFDTLASPRIYRGPLEPEETLRIMEREAGRALDPDLFEVFQRMLLAEDLAAAGSS